MKIKISGHSDDVVCVEGDVTDEFYPSEDQPFFVGVSDGTLLRISYDGMWNIRVLITGSDDTKITYEPATDEDTNYSDIVTLENDDEWCWVVAGSGGLTNERTRN